MAAHAAALPDAVTTTPGLVAEDWERMVWTHARLIYRIAFAVLRNHHDAEDAAQETLQRAWKYRARLAEVEMPAAWLARIAWRVAKARRPRPGMVPLDLLENVSSLRASGLPADESVAQREMNSLLEAMIEHLPAKLRQPLILSTIEELSAREIGTLLHIPEASVRTRCLRARQLLRQKLEARGAR